MTITTNPVQIIAPLQEPAIDYSAALYWLDGHYLFRHRVGERGWASKFVTSADLAAAFSGSEQDTGWLPAGVVRAGSNARGRWFVYSAPAQKVEILFEGDPAPIKVPIPRTVLLGVGGEFRLWALAANHFDLNAKVFHAPFPNVHPDGKICWGSNTPKAADPGKAREPWELFFATPFNRDLAQNKSQAHKDDVRKALRELAGKREYPAGDLEAVGGTRSIGALIDSILRGE